MSIFDQPHVFIVFIGGAGGNFISGVVNELLHSTLTPINISNTGSSHTVLRDKSKGTDFLSFGTVTEEHELFESQEKRELFYLEHIKNTYSSTNSKPEVVWTHDFSNIPLYRKYFKNSKILVITTFTVNEHLTSLFMLATKAVLDKNCLIPMTTEMWSIFTNQWIVKCTDMLNSFMSRDETNKIMSDYYNNEYRDILLYATVTMFLNKSQMLPYVDEAPEKELLLDYTMDIDDDCIILPYRYLADNNVDLLIEKLSEVLAKTLNEDEINYVKTSFNQYRSAQSESILSNPAEYYKELRRKILNN